jgi:hypothetical protein
MEHLPYTFSHEEVDLLVCALLRYQTLGEALLERFS